MRHSQASPVSDIEMDSCRRLIPDQRTASDQLTLNPVQQLHAKTYSTIITDQGKVFSRSGWEFFEDESFVELIEEELDETIADINELKF